MLFSGRDFPTLEQSKHSPKPTGGAASAFPLPNHAPDLTDTAPHSIESLNQGVLLPSLLGRSLTHHRRTNVPVPTTHQLSQRASFGTPHLFITTVLTADLHRDLLYQTAPTASHSPPTEQQPGHSRQERVWLVTATCPCANVKNLARKALSLDMNVANITVCGHFLLHRSTQRKIRHYLISALQNVMQKFTEPRPK